MENKTKSKPTTTKHTHTQINLAPAIKTGIQGVEVGAVAALLLQTEARTERHPLELAAYWS